jgi:hypothetical protein
MVVLGVVATALLTGQAIDPAKKYEVTVGAYGDLEKAYKAVIATDDFKKKFPNVNLKFQTSDFGGHHNRLTTVIAAGEQTNDIEALEVGYIAQFVQAGGLTDLNAAPFNAKKLSKDLVKFAVANATTEGGALIAMPVDIALFGLHGAMVAEGYEDCEGDLLARAREIVGPKAIVGAEYDLHCHLTEKRVAACDVVVLFKEFPHTDFLARAEDLVDLAIRAWRGEIRPTMEMFDCRTLTGAFMTNQPIGRAFIDRIFAMEGKDGILSISIGHCFPYADVEELTGRILVITDEVTDKYFNHYTRTTGQPG